jgi:hypothetical protein
MDDADRCPKCHYPLDVGSWPFCNPHGGPHGKGINQIQPDSYGQTITCETMGHEPVHYDTRSERKRLMKLHNVEEFVRHQPTPGSDKSPHTINWANVSVDLDAAESLVKNPSRGTGVVEEPQVPFTWSVRPI